MISHRPRVLVVDDDRFVRTLVGRSLAIHHMDCDLAEDGGVAVERIKATSYDLIITDLRMPKCHGHALCQMILDRPDRPLLVVITGVAEPRILRDLQSRGVDALYQKPLDFSAFAQRMRQMVDERRGTQPVAALPSDEKMLEVIEAATGERSASSVETAAFASTLTIPQKTQTMVFFLSDWARARRLAAELETPGLRTVVPETTDALCWLVQESRIDLIVIENARFGFLTGADVLSHLQSGEAPPPAIVIADPGSFDPERIPSANIRKIFPRDATDSDLVQAVRSALVDSERTGRTISPEARNLVKTYGAPVYSPAVLLKLASYLQMCSLAIPVDQLTKDLMADAAITAELLRLANGSSLGARRPITEISEAIKFLGASRAASLLLSSSIRNVEGGLLRKLPPELRAWYQLRTVIIASISSVFAERHFQLSGDTAFVLGLFQDMGILVLANAHGDRYLRLVDHARKVGPVRLHAIEQQYFELTHAEVSAALIERWQLPEKLIRPIRFHHEPSARVSERNDPLAFVPPMRIGEAFADLWENRHPTREHAMSKLLSQCPAAKNSNFKESFAEGMRRAAEVSQLFLLPLPDENEALAMCKDIVATYAELYEPEAAGTT